MPWMPFIRWPEFPTKCQACECVAGMDVYLGWFGKFFVGFVPWIRGFCWLKLIISVLIIVDFVDVIFAMCCWCLLTHSWICRMDICLFYDIYIFSYCHYYSMILYFALFYLWSVDLLSCFAWFPKLSQETVTCTFLMFSPHRFPNKTTEISSELVQPFCWITWWGLTFATFFGPVQGFWPPSGPNGGFCVGVCDKREVILNRISATHATTSMKTIEWQKWWKIKYVNPLGGGFKYFWFSPRNVGTWSTLTHIFQMGWNHQLVYVRKKVSLIRDLSSPLEFPLGHDLGQQRNHLPINMSHFQIYQWLFGQTPALALLGLPRYQLSIAGYVLKSLRSMSVSLFTSTKQCSSSFDFRVSHFETYRKCVCCCCCCCWCGFNFSMTLWSLDLRLFFFGDMTFQSKVWRSFEWLKWWKKGSENPPRMA